jgi:ubiquinone/menaquinone biosynthesis C-methylase UbiE
MLDNPIRRFRYPPERLILKLGVGSNDVVVDFGCGPGFFLIPLANVAGRAIGVDVSPRMLEKAAQHAKKKGVTIELLQSDGTGIQLEDSSVDLILLNHVFHELEDKPRVLGEFHRVLKPSGRLAIVEKTRGSSKPWRIMGPPIVDQTELNREIQQTGLRFAQTIEHGNDSIVIGQKVD